MNVLYRLYTKSISKNGFGPKIPPQKTGIEGGAPFQTAGELWYVEDLKQGPT